MPELKPIHNYRIDFPIAGETEKKRLQLMERITDLKKELEKKGHRGTKGLKNLVCYAPYTNAAVCLTSTLGDEEWLPKAIQEVKLAKQDSWESKIFLSKSFIHSFKPTPAKIEEEKLWYESINKKMGLKKFYEQYVIGEPETITQKVAMEQREEETKRITELLQQPLDTGNGNVYQPHLIDEEKKEKMRKLIKNEQKIKKNLMK